MNRLVWKLLRQHLSGSQLAGFFLANLLGMGIVLLSWQFYRDVLPVFTQGDSFMKTTYAVLGKRVTMAQTLRGETPGFSEREITALRQQPFARSVGCFTPAQFDVYASVGSEEMGVGLSTDMFLESLPDAYVDADLSRWTYHAGSDTLPVILPRNYLNLYNFGFASTRGLPALSESLVGMVNIHFRLSGTQGTRRMTGRIVAFSDRINTILVPQNFMDEANAALSPGRQPRISRLVLEMKNPADERMAAYLSQHDYEEEGGAADGGRTVYFLRLVVGVVLCVGLVICALSFYVLLLSIYLLLQKHTGKIDTLLLLGYSPFSVALPFHALGFLLNALVLLLAMGGVVLVRNCYLPQVMTVYPHLAPAGILPMVLMGLGLTFGVSLLNFVAVRRKIRNIWYLHRR